MMILNAGGDTFSEAHTKRTINSMVKNDQIKTLEFTTFPLRHKVKPDSKFTGFLQLQQFERAYLST